MLCQLLLLPETFSTFLLAKEFWKSRYFEKSPEPEFKCSQLCFGITRRVQSSI